MTTNNVMLTNLRKDRPFNIARGRDKYTSSQATTLIDTPEIALFYSGTIIDYEHVLTRRLTHFFTNAPDFPLTQHYRH